MFLINADITEGSKELAFVDDDFLHLFAKTYFDHEVAGHFLYSIIAGIYVNQQDSYGRTTNTLHVHLITPLFMQVYT